MKNLRLNRVRTWLLICFGYGFPLLLAGVSSTYRGIVAYYAAISMNEQLPVSFPDDQAVQKAQSRVQSHFAKFGVHVPFDDIWITRDGLDYQRSLAAALVKDYGYSQIYVWVPMYVRIPFWGRRVFEWCWIPPQSQKTGLF